MTEAVNGQPDPETYKKRVYTFEIGTPEDWVIWRIAANQFFQEKGVLEDTTDNATKRHSYYNPLFKGEAKEK